MSAIQNYSRTENTFDKLLDAADPFSPYRKWYSRSRLAWKKRNLLPRRVSRISRLSRRKIKRNIFPLKGVYSG